MVENNGKIEIYIFSNTPYMPSSRYICQSSTTSFHHATISAQSQIYFYIRVFQTGGFNAMLLFLKVGFNGLTWLLT